MARAEERKEVIDVVQDMIDNYQELFEVSHHLIITILAYL